MQKGSDAILESSSPAYRQRRGRSGFFETAARVSINLNLHPSDITKTVKRLKQSMAGLPDSPSPSSATSDLDVPSSSAASMSRAKRIFHSLGGEVSASFAAAIVAAADVKWVCGTPTSRKNALKRIAQTAIDINDKKKKRKCDHTTVASEWQVTVNLMTCADTKLVND